MAGKNNNQYIEIALTIINSQLTITERILHKLEANNIRLGNIIKSEKLSLQYPRNKKAPYPK